MKPKHFSGLALYLCAGLLTGCAGLRNPPPPSQFQLNVSIGTAKTGTVTSTPAGINCPTTCSATFQQGTQVTLTASPATDYSFSGWSGGCSGSSACTITLSANTTIAANFSQSTFQLTVTGPTGNTGTVTSNPSGINCPTTCSAAFQKNSQVTLTPSAASNYSFSGWSGACSGSSTCTLTLTADSTVSANFSQSAFPLSVNIPTANSGAVTSNPPGINCPTTCSATFQANTQVTLIPSAATGYSFSGWSGACSGSSTCDVTVTASDSVTATFSRAVYGLNSLNHIIFMAQENRSFDEYFGYMRQYWANNGIADQQFDGLPQFTPASQCTTTNGVSSCAVPTVPACDPSQPPPAACVADPNAKPVPTFHILSECTEVMSPFWNEAYIDWNYDFSYPNTIAWEGNGFIQAAANDARQASTTINDTNGYRSMGYFTDQDLNYYYFMASNFATSDRWFAPVLSRTQVNRAYILAATSQGYAYPPGSNANDSHGFTSTPIFEALQNAGITWRVYVDASGPECGGLSGSALNQCLAKISYVNMFDYESQIQSDPSLYQNFVPKEQFLTDVQNDSTLPQVIYFDPPSDSGLDEHPADNDNDKVNIQNGATWVSTLINALMTSPSWKDSALIFTYDEPGGFYEHVQPQPVPVPDQYAYPIDLESHPTFNDACYGTTATSGVCSFGLTGYRIPLIVVSPFAKKNYVSHTVRDSTAWLSLVEERFGITPLTARDSYWLTETDSTTSLPGKMDEFFDFNNPPWMTPPSPPTQNQGGACNFEVPNPWGS
ncbi:MAG TPA: alkaline phosphatase family protein [Candidatus Sulfotelmatobacter sp.]|nr:alkaline phosphatase family protein [Candidatus Sulfotelmatobacter sp.]